MSGPNDMMLRTLEFSAQRRIVPVMTAQASLDLLLSANAEIGPTITALADMISALGPLPTQPEPSVVSE